MTQATTGANPTGEGAANEGGAICRELFEELAQGVFYQRADGVLLDINPAGVRMLGYTREEFLSGVCLDPRWKLVDEQGRALTVDEHPSTVALSTGRPVRGVLLGVYNPALGEYRWLTVTAIPQFRAGEGKPHQVVVTMHDETELKRSRDLAMAQGRLLDAHLFNSPLGTIEFDPELGITRWSDEAQRIFGWTAAEVLGKGIFDLCWVHEEDIPLVRGETNGLDGGVLPRSTLKNRNYTKDGRVLHCQWYNSGVYDQSGNLLSIFSQVLDVTDKVRGEEELQRSKERLEATIRTAMDTFWVTDMSGRILSANDAACEMLGYTLEELLTKHIWEIEAIESPTEVKARTKEMAQTGRGRFESKHRRKDGTAIDVEVSCNYQPWEGGRFLAFVRDISWRKAHETRLLEREKWLQDSQRAGRVGSYSYDLVADRWESTQVMDEIFGITEGFNKNLKGWFSLIAPDQLQRSHDYFATLLAAGGDLPFDIQYKIIRPSDGRERWLHGKGEFIKNEEGRPVKLIGAISDITEMLSVNSALVESEARFSVFMENLPAAAFIKDEEGRVLMANRFLRDLLGGEEWLGKTTRQLFPPEVAEKMVADDLAALSRGLTVVTETVTDRTGRERTFETYKFPVSLSGGKKLLGGIAVETTEKMRMQEHLFRTQKLESLGVLAGGIAHDFNNILTGILGNLSLASAMLEPESLALPYLVESEKATLRATQLSGQLLTFSRGGEPVRKTLETAKIVADAVSFALRGSNVKGELDLPADLWCLDADEGQINQVLNNLLINAKQAMAGGGRVVVRGANETIAGSSREETFPEGRYVRITIADEGEGIPEANLAKIFDPYFTTKTGGTGLGLSSAYSIVKRHGGRLGVSSTPGRGSTFSVLLPATAEKPCAEEKRMDRESPVHSGGRILVMDDEAMIRDMLGAMLKSLGFTPETCADGAATIDLYRQALAAGTPFDLVILDLTVPGGLGGLETARRILDLHPTASLVVSSGYSDDPVVAGYRDHGFAASISKPYTMGKLSSELAKVLTQKRDATCGP